MNIYIAFRPTGTIVNLCAKTRVKAKQYATKNDYHNRPWPTLRDEGWYIIKYIPEIG